MERQGQVVLSLFAAKEERQGLETRLSDLPKVTDIAKYILLLNGTFQKIVAYNLKCISLFPRFKLNCGKVLYLCIMCIYKVLYAIEQNPDFISHY